MKNIGIAFVVSKSFCIFIVQKNGTPEEMLKRTEAINERINELLKQSIKSEGVINIFSDIKEKFSIFDPKLLEEIAEMKQKNFAVELLRKLIAEQIRVYQRTN